MNAPFRFPSLTWLTIIFVGLFGFFGKTHAYVGEDLGMDMYKQIDTGNLQLHEQLISRSLNGSAAKLDPIITPIFLNKFTGCLRPGALRAWAADA